MELRAVCRLGRCQVNFQSQRNLIFFSFYSRKISSAGQLTYTNTSEVALLHSHKIIDLVLGKHYLLYYLPCSKSKVESNIIGVSIAHCTLFRSHAKLLNSASYLTNLLVRYGAELEFTVAF